MDPTNTPNPSKSGTKSLRLLRPSIVILCGPAACGKSTFAEKHFRPTQIISSDWARARISDDERDQRYSSQAFALVHFLVEQRLAVNRLCVVDSTALTAQARKDLVDVAKRFHVPTTLLLFDVPLQTCIERDEKRDRSVGTAIVERQYQTFLQSKETIAQEGFDQIVEFRDGEQDKVEVEILFRPLARPPQRPDVGAPRRFERPGQSSRPHPNGRGGNSRFAPSPLVPPAVHQAVESPRATSTVVATAGKVANPQATTIPVPAARTQASAVARPPASTSTLAKPLLPSQASSTAKPSSASEPGTVPAGVDIPGEETAP